jgi:hypothetical protein
MDRIPLVEVVADAYDVARVAVVAAAEAHSATIVAEKEAIAAVKYAAIAREKFKGAVDSVKNSTFVYANATDKALVIFLHTVYFLETDPFLHALIRSNGVVWYMCELHFGTHLACFILETECASNCLVCIPL